MLAERNRATNGNRPSPEHQAAVVMIDHRMTRAAEARARGESRDVIDRSLTGVL